MSCKLARGFVLPFAVLCILLVGGCAKRVTEVDDAALRAADGDSADWLTYGRTYTEQRFSPLKEIDEQSVGKLGLAWTYDLETLRGVESTPLVKDGVLYVTSSWSLVYAFDARAGNLLWKYDPQVPKDHAKYVCCDVVNRGVALYKGRAYVGTLDGRLIALDAKTGAPVWDVQTTPKDGSYAITGAPRIAKGRVLIGNAGSEYPVRGYISAYDAVTGNLVWRTYTVPGDPSKPFESDAMKRAASTWSGEWWKAGGGGTAWDAIVYDPELDFVYFGTGNGSPWYDTIRSKGENLYIASIVAVRAETGEQVWAYQTTPGDNWDYDATQPLMLATLSIGGAQRRVVLQANKNGFFYVIDRENGNVISARTYAPVNWATGMDSKGRPVENPAARQLKDAVLIQPSAEGAHNWNPMSFSPITGLIYLPVLYDTSMHALIPNWKINLHDQTTGYDRAYRGPVRDEYLKLKSSGRLLAWDPVAQKEVWHVDMPDPKSGGTLATGGNLVFQGRSDGQIHAYRATDGQDLWKFDAGVGIAAPPMTYTVDGVQYISVVSGWGGPQVLGNRPPGHGNVGPGKLLTFKLGGTLTLPPFQRVVRPVPMPTFKLPASSAEVEQGRILFANFCSRCHGGDVVSGGSVPDLRYAAEGTHEMFEQIVLGGARHEFGMPSFMGDLTSAQVRLIHAYILERARESAQAK
ncbi:MAG TPA: PQQ-dependent dehydrogenase, methanol/ethanol family [Candidatus Sulfotelmatobacter sp.]|jgi:quinohemoprotein ethanol dehydrogenase|nr:PQQ-dependent dehydrogenase, methanol/ethanol family [Candidatus Sulfotelmatobacter sp.]